jgi:hypothetical protein
VGGEQALHLAAEVGPVGAGAGEVGGPLGGAGDSHGGGEDRFVGHSEPPYRGCRARLIPLCEIQGWNAPRFPAVFRPRLAERTSSVRAREAPEIVDGKRSQGGLKGSKAAAKVNHVAALRAYRHIGPTIIEMRGQGLSYAAIAERLNAEGHTTRRGRPWNAMQVCRLCRRAAAKPAA